MGQLIISLIRLAWNLGQLLFTVLIYRPAAWIGVKVMERFSIRKNTLALYGLGLAILLMLLTSLQLFATVVVFLWIAAAFVLAVSISFFTIQEEEGFISDVEWNKEQKALDKAALKDSKNVSNWEDEENEDLEYVDVLSRSEVIELIETAMSGSKLYPQEDFEKRPNFYLSEYYVINNIAPDGEVDVTFRTYSGADMVKTTDDLRKNLSNILASSFQYEGAEEYIVTGQLQGSINLKLYPVMPDDGKIDFVADTFIHTDEIWEDTNHLEQGIPYAVDENRNRLYYQPYENHALAGGSSGGGKSVWARNIVAGLCKSDAIIVGLDLKMGVELEPFSDRLTALATTPDEAVKLLEVLVNVMNVRYGIARSRGLQGVPKDSKEFPLIAVVMDEIAQLTDSDNFPTKALKDEYWIPIMSNLKKLYTLSRAANMVLIAMTQSPKATIVDTNMRNNIKSSFGMLTKDNTQLVTIIGPDGDKIPTITPDEVGSGYGVGKGFGSGVTKFKTYFISTERLNELIKETAVNNPDVRANDKYNSWKLLGEFEDEVWNSRLTFWEEIGMITSAGYDALINTESLLSIRHKLTEKEVNFILKSYLDMLPDGKLIAKRFTFEDINAFADM